MAGEKLDRRAAIAARKAGCATIAAWICRLICKTKQPCRRADEGSRGVSDRRQQRAWQQGDPQQARRAFQAAYGLSTHDAAFNEDARVQLHNLKLQQALVGLNVRQAATAGDPAALGGKFRDLRHARK